MSTGFPAADARDDFARARRRALLAELSRRLRREPDDVELMLPFDEVVTALGRLGERDLGLQVVALDTIVGSVDRTRDFDRQFRPATPRVRTRWERIATAMRRGEAMPPIDLYRVGEAHFVRDGHHRVSVARTLGRGDIDARVVEVSTRVGADRRLRRGDLPFKSHERLFAERVPLGMAERARIQLSDPWAFGDLAENVEAWGMRAMQDRGDFLDRGAVAARWFADEYRPVVDMLREAEMIGAGTETEAYMRVACERYRLLRTHEWSEDILDRLRLESRK